MDTDDAHCRARLRGRLEGHRADGIGLQLSGDFGDAVLHRYLPFDLPGFQRRFLARIKPVAGVLMTLDTTRAAQENGNARDSP